MIKLIKTSGNDVIVDPKTVTAVESTGRYTKVYIGDAGLSFEMNESLEEVAKKLGIVVANVSDKERK